MLGAITDNTTQAELLRWLEEGDVSKNLQGRLRGSVLDGSAAGASMKKIANIQNYYHILSNQRRSLSGFIKNAGKASPNQVGRARARMRAVDAVTEYLDKKEWETMDGILKESTEGKRHQFYFADYNFTKVKNWRSRKHENKDDSVHYVYRVYKGKDGITRYKQDGWVKKGSTKYLGQGEYVVLKNPVRYHTISQKDKLDGWALFQATGDITAENIHLMPDNDSSINRFIFDVDGTLTPSRRKIASEFFDGDIEKYFEYEEKIKSEDRPDMV